MSWYYNRKKTSVSATRAKAIKAIAKLEKSNSKPQPVIIEGRKIATTFWGEAWCDNLGRYSDYASRLPRGRSYVRHRAVIDLNISAGCIEAKVQGSSLYNVRVKVSPLTKKHWNEFKKDMTGEVSSVIELLSGNLSTQVMQKIIAKGSGLFPRPSDINMKCNCPDWSNMCKHVAAVMYGVGNRLDTEPELIFTLRQQNVTELVDAAISGPVLTQDAITSGSTSKQSKTVNDKQLSSLFGVDIELNPDITTEQEPVKPMVDKRKAASAMAVAMVKNASIMVRKSEKAKITAKATATARAQKKRVTKKN